MRAAKPNGWSAVVRSRGRTFPTQKKTLYCPIPLLPCPRFSPSSPNHQGSQRSQCFLEYSFSGLPVLLSYPLPKQVVIKIWKKVCIHCDLLSTVLFFVSFPPLARELGAKGKMAFGWEAFRCRVCRYALGFLTCSTQRKPPTPQDPKKYEAFWKPSAAHPPKIYPRLKKLACLPSKTF